MFDEEKVKKDLEKMRGAYQAALKRLEDIQARQKKIAQEIYEARKLTIEE
jgi:hypothetical protein